MPPKTPQPLAATATSRASYRRRAFGLSLVLAGLLGATQASAVSEPPRQTYSDQFSTDVPGASAGRTIAIDFVNPADPEAKPPAFSHLQIKFAEGTRFDTSAVPYCTASDPELMAAGASACPQESALGTDEILVDTGFPEPERYLTSDIVFFNNKDELILLATIRENGTRVVLRGQVGVDTLDIEVPPLPGTPPEGGAAKRERGTFQPRSVLREGKQRNYLTTPPTCPASGEWVNRITYTYRDGVEQTAISKSPCRPSAPPAGDTRTPRIGARGLPRRCVSAAFRTRFRIRDASALRSVVVRLDGKRVAGTRRKRFTVRVPAGRLRAGRHTIRVAATDAAGNRGTHRFRFRRCNRAR